MALSTPPPPPPPDPSTTTTATASVPATTTTRPLFPRPPNPHHHPSFYSSSSPRLPSNPNPNYPQLAPRPNHDPHLLYPLSSSGRGYLSRPAVARASSPRPPFVFPYSDQTQGYVRPPSHMLVGSTAVVKGIPLSSSQHLKAGHPSASLPETNGHKDFRDRSRDDNLAIIRDRKVRVQDNASLYALCRSWLRNGFPEETQPQYLDAVKSLPRPLPMAADVDSPAKKEGDKEEVDEDEGSVENMSAKELLQGHIKRARRVRSRLREERLQRITRYKTRLALLLPPVVDHHFKNDTAAPN